MGLSSGSLGVPFGSLGTSLGTSLVTFGIFWDPLGAIFLLKRATLLGFLHLGGVGREYVRGMFGGMLGVFEGYCRREAPKIVGGYSHACKKARVFFYFFLLSRERCTPNCLFLLLTLPWGQRFGRGPTVSARPNKI